MRSIKDVVKCVAKYLLPLAALTAGTAQGEVVQTVTQYSYDNAGQLTCTAVRMNTAAFGSLPSDACSLGTTGGYGPDRIVKNQYDAAGQLTEIDQAYGVVGTQRAYARYFYTNNGLKLYEVDANGNTTEYAYDGFDRLSRLYYPSTTIGSGASNGTDYESYGYDSNGNRTSWRRRDGQTFGYSYDNLNRETLKDVPGGTAADVYTGYDGLGHVLYRRFVSDSGQGVSYAYDGLGRVSQTTDINGRTIWYAYNQASARTQLTFPDINAVVYGLDAANRISTAGFNSATGLASMGYDNLGRLTTIWRQGGTTYYAYNALGQMTAMTNDLNGTAYDIGWAFVYNPAGQLSTSNATSTAYDYKEKTNSTISPTYDGLNRDARLLSTTAYCTAQGLSGYDLRQNVQCDGVNARTFLYDVENRLLSGTSSTANVRMVYDPEGRLSKYSTDGGATWSTYLYDGVNLVATYDSSGMAARYVHGGGTDNPLVWMVGPGTGTTRPLYTDYHGSVIATTDTSGTLLDLYKYGPYGEPKNINNDEYWGGSAFRYTGQTTLPQLQLYYYKARVYDPNWGRFLQTDPIGSGDDLDLYSYGKGDPVNGSDPTGTIYTTAEGGSDFCSNWCDGDVVSFMGATEAGGGAPAGSQATPGIGHNGGPALEDDTVSADAFKIGGNILIQVGGKVAGPVGVVLVLVQADPAGPGENAAMARVNQNWKDGQDLLNAKPTGSALKGDATHRSATFFRAEAAKDGTHFKITGGDGVVRTLTQIPGQLNNVQGRYEYIVEGSNLTHQRFVAGGTINGIPNAK